MPLDFGCLSLAIAKYISLKGEFVMTNSNLCDIIEVSKVRSGLKDVWNAFMLEGASYTENDIPICHATAVAPP